MTVLIAPGLLRYAEEMPELQELAKRGRVRCLTPVVGIPEAAWLGLPPTHVADGSLIVAALGAEPPERTLGFHVSVLGLGDGLVVPPPPSPKEAAVIESLLPKLNTKRLIALPGEGVDHALVMEGLWDLGTASPEEAMGKFKEVLPEGDQEFALRQYIDSSVNMLSEQEFNLRRIDEERAPLNVLWPWGHGAPKRLPNLALHRGVAGTVASTSLRLRGVTRLVGYRSELIIDGLKTDWPSLKADFIHLQAFEKLDPDEAVWSAQEADNRFFAKAMGRLLVVSDGLLFETNGEDSGVPFRPDVVEENTIPKVDLWDSVQRFVTSAETT